MKPKGLLIFIGLQAATRASSGAQYYRPPDELTAMYQVGQSVQDIENQGDAESQNLKYSYPVLQ